MPAQQEAQMLPFVLPVEDSSAKKGRACAQCIGEVAGGAWRVYGACSVKKSHDTLVVCRMQKCACVVQCDVRVSCGEQFTRHMLGADADRDVGSQSCAVERVCGAARVAVVCIVAARAAMARMRFLSGEEFSRGQDLESETSARWAT